jgi:hypothetical protein
MKQYRFDKQLNYYFDVVSFTSHKVAVSKWVLSSCGEYVVSDFLNLLLNEFVELLGDCKYHIYEYGDSYGIVGSISPLRKRNFCAYIIVYVESDRIVTCFNEDSYYTNITMLADYVNLRECFLPCVLENLV